MSVPWFSRLVAALQLVGSSWTAQLLLMSLPNFLSNPLGLLAYVPSLIIIVGAFLSGIWIWNGEERGYKVGTMVQLFQIPVLSSVTLTYKFVFGFGIVLNMVGGDRIVMFHTGTHSYFALFNTAATFLVGLNIWAIVVAAYLWWQYRNRGVVRATAL